MKNNRRERSATDEARYQNDGVELLLKKALRCSETPDAKLVQKIKQETMKEEFTLKKTTMRRSFRMAATLAAVLVLLTTTAFAAWHFLTPGEVAEQFGDQTLSAAFNSENAININESQTAGGHIFTLMSIVSGRDISDHPWRIDGEISRDETYAVIAIRKEDGSPMNFDDWATKGRLFHISPYVKGFKPWQMNMGMLGGGGSATIIDGVEYVLIRTNDITMFADCGVYIGITEGFAFGFGEAFVFDEETGEITPNPDYDGVNVLFDLPLDPSLGDPEKVEQFIESLFAEPEPGELGNDVDEYGNPRRVIEFEREITVHVDENGPPGRSFVHDAKSAGDGEDIIILNGEVRASGLGGEDHAE